MCYYDFPVFNATRKADDDVSMVLFTNRVIIERISRAKLLFVISKQSLTNPDHKELDTLVTGAIKLIKKARSYNQSLALVVTVENEIYQDNSALIDDVVYVLKLYRIELANQIIDSDFDDPWMLIEKARFVNTILHRSQDGSIHDKILILHSDYDVGDHQDSFKLLQLIDTLTYAPINVYSGFNVSLEGSSTHAIDLLSTFVNDNITCTLEAVTDCMKEQFRSTMIPRANFNLVELNETIQHLNDQTTRLDELFYEATNATSIAGYISILRRLGMYMEIGQEVLNGKLDHPAVNLGLLEEITAMALSNTTKWLDSLLTIQDFLSGYKDWYSFCLEVQKEAFSYDFVFNANRHPEFAMGNSTWLEFVHCNVLNVSDKILKISKQIGQSDFDILQEMFKFVTQPIEASCDKQNRHLHINAHFFRLSDLDGIARKCNHDVILANINIGHTVFIDKGKWYNKLSLILIAPILTFRCEHGCDEYKNIQKVAELYIVTDNIGSITLSSVPSEVQNAKVFVQTFIANANCSRIKVRPVYAHTTSMKNSLLCVPNIRSRFVLNYPSFSTSLLEYRRFLWEGDNIFMSHMVRQTDMLYLDSGFTTFYELANETFFLGSLDTSKRVKSSVHWYRSIIERLEFFYKNRPSSGWPEKDQKVLNMLLTTCYSDMQYLEISRGSSIVVDVSGYLDLILDECNNLKVLKSFQAVNLAKEIFHGDIKQKIKECYHYINDVVNPALNGSYLEVSQSSDLMEEELRDLVTKSEENEAKYRNKIAAATKRVRILKAAEIGVGLLNDLILTPLSFFLPIPSLDAVVAELREKYSDQKQVLQNCQRLLEDARRATEDLTETENKFNTKLLPLLKPTIEYLRNISKALYNGQSIEISHLMVTKWEVNSKLNELKAILLPIQSAVKDLKFMSDALNKLLDAFVMSIELYELIQKYVETQQIADYIATVNSASLAPIQITDPMYTQFAANFDIKVLENTIGKMVNNAVFAFKQWVFPFAVFYSIPKINRMTKDYLRNPHNRTEITEILANDAEQQIQRLKHDLQLYKVSTIGGQDNFIFETNFSSGHKTSRPFYTWNVSDYQMEISKLLKGEEVTLYADVHRYGLNGRDAVKFKQIEIYFGLTNASKAEQATFDATIEYFGVSMTHTGISKYRFQNSYYNMIGAPQTIVYSFERDSDGNRLETNIIYEKFKKGDYLLSPFTQWKLKLRLRNLVRLRTKKDLIAVGWEDLAKFASKLNVELVGIGTYVDANAASVAAGGNLQVESFYEVA